MHYWIELVWDNSKPVFHRQKYRVVGKTDAENGLHIFFEGFMSRDAAIEALARARTGNIKTIRVEPASVHK